MGRAFGVVSLLVFFGAPLWVWIDNPAALRGNGVIVLLFYGVVVACLGAILFVGRR